MGEEENISFEDRVAIEAMKCLLADGKLISGEMDQNLGTDASAAPISRIAWLATNAYAVADAMVIKKAARKNRHERQALIEKIEGLQKQLPVICSPNDARGFEQALLELK